MITLITRAKEFDLGQTALYRLLGLVLAFAGNSLVIVLLSRKYGDASYAAFALISSLINLLPFADLGLGASVVNATSDFTVGKYNRTQYRNHVSRARDILVIVCLLMITGTAVARSFGFERLFLGNLGSTPGVVDASMFTLACISVSVPLGMGARILQGLGSMIDVVRIGILGPVLQILLYVPFAVFGSPPSAYYYGPGSAYVIVALVTYFAARKRAGTRLLLVFSSFRSKLSSDHHIWTTAAPFLLISVGMAVGFQSHRLLLSQFGTIRDVASYSLVAQFLGPLLAILSVVGQNLWSRYRSELSFNSLDIGSFRSHLIIFAMVGSAFAFGLIIFVPIASHLLTGGVVNPPILVSVAAGGYLLVTAIHQPSAMLLNDTKGLWFQACCVVVVAICTIIGIISTVGVLGSAAPYVCTVLCMVVLQVGPSLKVAIGRIRQQA